MPGMPLVSGLTATAAIRDGQDGDLIRVDRRSLGAVRLHHWPFASIVVERGY
jgi:hypothetical protein